MSGLLDELYRLQERLRFVQAREKQRDTVPAELTEVDSAFREKLDAVAKLKQRLIEAELERLQYLPIVELRALCRSGGFAVMRITGHRMPYARRIVPDPIARFRLERTLGAVPVVRHFAAVLTLEAQRR